MRFLQSWGYYVNWVFLTFVWQPVLKENSKCKTIKQSLKNDLMWHPARAEEFVNSYNYKIYKPWSVLENEADYILWNFEI